MLTLKVSLELDLEPGSPVYKTFLESLPYYLGNNYAVTLNGNMVLIEGVADAAAEQLTQATLEALVAAQAEHKMVREKCLHNFEGEFSVKTGVYEALQERGALFATGFGKLAYSGILADVFHALDNFFKQRCLAMGAQQELYPPAVEGETLLRAGYFDTLAQHAYFIAPLKTNLNSLKAAQKGTVLQESGNTHLQVPEWVLSPTVCHHCFEARKDSNIELPLKVTAINQCSRYEVHDTNGMRRLRMYWMREFIQFDRDEIAVADSLEQLLQFTTRVLEKWGVSHQVLTANDPFFPSSATDKRVFQNIFALKRELRLPIQGGSLACASFNNHQKSLVGAFNIKQHDASATGEIASGCVGWGYDRLLLGLFSQLGVDVKVWPKEVRDDLGL